MFRLVPSVRTSVALCCALIALAGCGDKKRPAAAATPTSSPTAQQRLDLAVVGLGARIGKDDTLGAGFVIDGDRGLVLTAAHTIWGARSLKVITAVGVLHGRIVARAPCDDLALVEVYPRVPGLSALPAGTLGDRGAQRLRSLGRRDASGGNSSLASIPVKTTAALDKQPGFLPLPSAGVALDSPLVPEVSGGPVVDEQGRLVGMAEATGAPSNPSAKSPAVTVPWSWIKQRLDQLQPGPRRVYVGWANQYRCVGRQHAYARSMHPGYTIADARLNVPIAPTRLPGTEGVDG